MDIVSALSSEKGLLKELLNVLTREKQALINDNIEGLREAVRLKEDIKNKIQEAEEARVGEYGDIKLKELLPSLKENERRKVEKLGEEMKSLAHSIEEINNANRLLVEHSLDYVRSIINMMSPKKVTLYKPTGTVEGGESVSSMLNKSI